MFIMFIKRKGSFGTGRQNRPPHWKGAAATVSFHDLSPLPDKTLVKKSQRSYPRGYGRQRWYRDIRPLLTEVGRGRFFMQKIKI